MRLEHVRKVVIYHHLRAAGAEWFNCIFIERNRRRLGEN